MRRALVIVAPAALVLAPACGGGYDDPADEQHLSAAADELAQLALDRL